MSALVRVVNRGREHMVIVPEEFKSDCRKLAFRLVVGRREKDYQEYVEATQMLSTENMSADVASFLARMA